MNEGSEWIHYGAGMVYMRKQCYKDAANEFHKTLDINPSYANSYVQLGILNKKNGEKYAAKCFFNEALKLDPENEEANFQLGLYSLVDGELDDAKKRISLILKSNPLHIEAKINLAVVFGRKGDFVQGQALIEDVYALSRTHRDGFARLGWIKAATKDWPGALKLMTRDLKSERLSPTLQLNLARVYGHLGDFETAVDLIEEAYSQNKSLKDGYAKLGWIKAESQDWISAFGFMIKDYEKGRMSSKWQINLSMIQIFKGEYEGSVKLIEALYTDDKRVTDGYARMGWAHFLSSGNEQKLEFFIEKDVRLDRLSVEGKIISAIAMSIHGKLIPARILMDTLYSENSFLRDGFALMGWPLIEKGKLKAGITLIEKDYRLNRLSHIWKINYAYQLAKIGQAQKARALFNEVMQVENSRQEFCIGFQLKPSKIIKKSDLIQMIENAERFHCCRHRERNDEHEDNRIWR